MSLIQTSHHCFMISLQRESGNCRQQIDSHSKLFPSFFEFIGKGSTINKFSKGWIMRLIQTSHHWFMISLQRESGNKQIVIQKLFPSFLNSLVKVVQLTSLERVGSLQRERLTGGIALQGHYTFESSQTRLVVVFCAQLFKGKMPGFIDLYLYWQVCSAWLVASTFLVEAGLFFRIHDFHLHKYQLLSFLFQ